VADSKTVGNNQAPARRRYLFVSSDAHASPSMNSLRPYCPKSHLEEFDSFATALRDGKFATGERDDELDFADRIMAKIGTEAASPLFSKTGYFKGEDLTPWIDCEGYDDPSVRLRHMDDEGVAAEIVFAGGENGQMLPFGVGFGAGAGASRVDADLKYIGGHIWNEWLADHIAIAPDRMIGVMQIPIWDVEQAVKEVEWAAGKGLRAVNFPASRSDFPAYNDPVYEPLWEVCAALKLPLVTHTGGGEPLGVAAPGGHYLGSFERTVVLRRALPQLIFGGVFERHPNLKVVWTELRVKVFIGALAEMDSVYASKSQRKSLPRSPSEYFKTNCFNSGSFMAPFELELRYDIGINNLFYGRDYPHVEGTWPDTELAMRNSFAGLPEDEVRLLLGLNAIPVYGLDQAKLEKVADQIGPRPEDIEKPLLPSEFPAHQGKSFRDRECFVS